MDETSTSWTLGSPGTLGKMGPPGSQGSLRSLPGHSLAKARRYPLPTSYPPASWPSPIDADRPAAGSGDSSQGLRQTACLLCDPAGRPMALAAGNQPRPTAPQGQVHPASPAGRHHRRLGFLSLKGGQEATSCLSWGSLSYENISSGTVFSQPPKPSTRGLGPPPAAPDAWDSLHPSRTPHHIRPPPHHGGMELSGPPIDSTTQQLLGNCQSRPGEQGPEDAPPGRRPRKEDPFGSDTP